MKPELVAVHVVIVEEYDDPTPWGSGAIVGRECVDASLDYDEARQAYDSHAEFWADKSRFRVVWHTEYVRPEMARMLPEPRSAPANGAKETA